MDDFLTSSAGGPNNYENRLSFPGNSTISARSGEFSEPSSHYGSALMESGPGSDMVMDNFEFQGAMQPVENLNDRNSNEVKAGMNTTNEEQSLQINWDAYMKSCQSNMAPPFYFNSRNNTVDVPGLNAGMKLEAVDKNNPQSFCVATVVQVIGHRVRVRYDGYGRDDSNDLWCNFQAEELHPIGWCAQNGFPLQPPYGITCTLEQWRTFLTQTLTGALAAPRELFRKDHFQPRVHGFKVGMKLEVIHPSKPSVICPGTVVKSLGPYYFLVATDYIQELPSVTYCCHSDSGGIFPAGWSLKNGVELTIPTNYTKKPFSWEKYMVYCRAAYAPQHLFKQQQKPRPHKFKPGFKVEAVDLEQRGIIRMATVTNVMGRVLQLFFDGQSRFQFVECDSPDIHPIGWCKRTGHPLHTNYGKMPSKPLTKNEGSEFFDAKLKLTSFADVINRKNLVPKNSDPPPPPTSATPLPRKPVAVGSAAKPVEVKDDKNEKCQSLSPSDDEDDISDEEGNGTGSERLYHNKNQIYFNKTCCCGPLLNPEQVKLLPDATEPGKVSTVIRSALEKVARCAKDPGKVMDLMQEGSGVRVVLKHNGKVFKKAISRVDSRPKLERYLKRFCRRLVCCEFFLSLSQVSSPCPDKCKADEHGNLEGPKGLKAKRSREYFETKHLGVEKKKRGRKSKSDLAASEAAAQRAAAGIVTTVFHKGDRVPLPNLDLPVTAIADHLRNTATKILGNQSPTISVSSSESLILPKPVSSPSTAVITHTTTHTTTTPSPVTTNSVAPSPNVPSYGKPRLLPSPCLSSNPPITSPVGVNPNSLNATKPPDVQITQPSKKPGRPPPTNHPVPLRPKGPIPQKPLSVAEALAANRMKYFRKPTKNLPVLPQPLGDQANSAPVSSPKPVFRLTPPKFHAPTSPCSSNAGQQPPFSPRFVAVGSALQHGVNYRFTLPPRPNSSQTIMTSSHHVLPTPSTLSRTGPPPLIPAHSLSAGPSNVPPLNTSQTMLRPRMVTAAPNVCVTQRGTFVTTQTKNGVHAGTGNPNVNSVIGQSPDANALMHRMFSVVQNSQGPTGKSETQTIAQDTKEVSPTSQGGPSGRRVSLNVGGGMGAVTTAVRSGLLTNEEYVLPNGSTSGISEKSITEGGGYSLTITDNNFENAANDAAEGIGNESEGNDDGGGAETGTMSKKALWLHRRRKKKKARFTFVKGKGRRKKDGELQAQMGEDYPNDDEMVAMAMDQSDEGMKRARPPSMEEREGKRRGRPPKRIYQDGELEELKDPLFTPSSGVQVSPKRPKILSSSTNSTMPPKYPEFPGQTQSPGTARSQGVSSDVNGSPATTVAMTTNMTPQKAELMKSVVPHAVQSSQHPSLRSPVGKQNNTVNGFTSPPSKKSRLLSSPTLKKPRGYFTTSPKSPPTARYRRLATSFSSIGTNTSLPGCRGDACPYHPDNPRTWTVEQVAEYVEATDCKNYATLFLDQEIDGESLLLLTRNTLMQFTVMKLGPTLKMSNYIAQLRARASGLPT